MANKNKKAYNKLYSRVRLKAKEALMQRHKREYKKLFKLIWKKELLKLIK